MASLATPSGGPRFESSPRIIFVLIAELRSLSQVSLFAPPPTT